MGLRILHCIFHFILPSLNTIFQKLFTLCSLATLFIYRIASAWNISYEHLDNFISSTLGRPYKGSGKRIILSIGAWCSICTFSHTSIVHLLKNVLCIEYSVAMVGRVLRYFKVFK